MAFQEKKKHVKGEVYYVVVFIEYQNIELFYFYLIILQQIKDSIPNFLIQHLKQPICVHMQKK